MFAARNYQLFTRTLILYSLAVFVSKEAPGNHLWHKLNAKLYYLLSIDLP